jgi:hypothetical protein
LCKLQHALLMFKGQGSWSWNCHLSLIRIMPWRRTADGGRGNNWSKIVVRAKNSSEMKPEDKPTSVFTATKLPAVRLFTFSKTTVGTDDKLKSHLPRTQPSHKILTAL